jgi:hypothetical protein
LLEQGKKTVICSVVFVDIVDYSKKTVAKQVALKGWFNDLLVQALQNISVTDRIILDSGDGAALCFLGDPEEALFAANNLRVALNQIGYPELALRIGINLGPVKIVRDMNGQPNVLGDAINVAQRVMSFSEPNQILVSRSYYEVVSRLADEYVKLFRHMGKHKDKHVREHEVYEVCLTSTAMGVPLSLKIQNAADVESEEVIPALAVKQVPATSFDPQTLAQLDASLSQYLGPLAKFMVRKAAQKTSSLEELCGMLAESIPVGHHKTAFLSDIANLRPVPSSAHKDTSASEPGEPMVARGIDEESKTREWDPATLALSEQRLAQFLGPLAKILVKKTAKNAASLEELYRVLSKNIESEKDREAFLKMADKIH